MKKFTLFSAALAILLSTCAVGCTSDGALSFCRTGSIFPTAKNSQKYIDNIYLPRGTGSNCDPCEQVQPCSPCEPACNPCDNTACTNVIPGRIVQPVPTGG
ncbi:MAG: hypothetical protein LBT09_00575 [Planctomycetaceae bacterium]|jgi:hypothetical protein|nr:hypothetical protein [Planctomycetaceae bacterium]